MNSRGPRFKDKAGHFAWRCGLFFVYFRASQKKTQSTARGAMLFNSLEFLLFLPIVFAAYWILNKWIDRGPGVLRAQNLLLLIASYVFYGWWDWRFLSLIAFSTVVDYAVGLQIAKANARDLPDDAPAEARSRSARHWLWVSLAVNLGLLGYFKYAGFFIENWI
ncbi:MAG: hypothetical protein O2947_04265, partial [Bacteroidetes bacterium]|nr:hypothetical protein [Bacteroidota bacterium]